MLYAERNYMQKAVCHTIPLTEIIQKRQIYTERKEIGGCQGAALREE